MTWSTTDGTSAGSTSHDGRVRHTEFWERMDRHLGRGYAHVWADQFVIAGLGGRTAREALDAGELPKHVWRAVWEVLELPASER